MSAMPDTTPDAPGDPAAETREWLEQLYGTAEHGWLAGFAQNRATGGRRTPWAKATDLDNLTGQLQTLAATSCVWLGAAIRRQRTDGRGGAKDCTALPGLWVDIDIEGPGHHQGGHLARNLNHAYQIAEAFPLPPTAIIETGGGLQPWWLFDELHDIDPELEQTVAAWGATWTRIGTQHGVDLDNVWDLARILRVPGTTNRKEGLERPVTLTRTNWNARYGLDDLQPHLDEPPAPPKRRDPDAVPYIGPERPGDAYNIRHTGEEILARAGFTHARTDRNGDQHWTRPGKDPREGTSATVYADDGHTTIWSPTCRQQWPNLQIERPYDPFGLYTAIEHNGSIENATRTLGQAGYGEQPTDLDDILGASLREPEPEPWDEPTPLPGPPEAPDFPVHTLPDWMQQHVAAVADQIQAPIDLPAMVAIGSLAAAATGRAQVHITPNWTEPVNLYLTVAMSSGEGKSAAADILLDWLYKWETERVEQQRIDVEIADTAYEAARVKVEKLRKAMEINRDEIRKAIEERETFASQRPESARIIIDNFTPEAVAGLMHRTGGRLAVVSTEADMIDSVTKGRPGDRADINLYLKAWSGDRFVRDRKGSSETGPESTIIPRPLLTVISTVQPTVIQNLYRDQELMGRGFGQRFMVAAPTSLVGHRDQGRRYDGHTIPTTAAYNTRARALADQWSTWANPADLRLDPDARQQHRHLLTQIETHLAPGGRLAHLSEWTPKLTASIARYAGILHLAESNDTAREIDADTMTRAIDLGIYWLGHADTLANIESDRLDEQADAIMEWALGHDRFSIADLHKTLRRPAIGLNRAVDYVPAIELLEAHGWLRAVAPGDWQSNVGVKGAPSPQFDLWPGCTENAWRVKVPRGPRTAYRESARLSSLFPSHFSRGARFTRNYLASESTSPSPEDEAPPTPAPVDNSPPGVDARTDFDEIF